MLVIILHCFMMRISTNHVWFRRPANISGCKYQTIFCFLFFLSCVFFICRYVLGHNILPLQCKRRFIQSSNLHITYHSQTHGRTPNQNHLKQNCSWKLQEENECYFSWRKACLNDWAYGGDNQSLIAHKVSGTSRSHVSRATYKNFTLKKPS